VREVVVVLLQAVLVVRVDGVFGRMMRIWKGRMLVLAASCI